MIDTIRDGDPVPAERKARVFKNGRSQAVRIPAEFRFKTDEVYIERNPETGAITLSEKPPRPSWDEIFKMLDEAGFPEDFMADREQGIAEDREPL